MRKFAIYLCAMACIGIVSVGLPMTHTVLLALLGAVIHINASSE